MYQCPFLGTYYQQNKFTITLVSFLMNSKEAKLLFDKYLNNTCSDEEMAVLEAFLESYQGQKFLMDNNRESLLEESKTRVWNSILSQIYTKPVKKHPFSFKPYLVYAAAASLVMALGITFFFQQTNIQENVPQVVQQPIEKGIDKAVLTLDDGTAITLEKGHDYVNQNVDSNGESLIYDKKDNSEIVYNYLTVPRGGQFFVELSDGTKVWLNSESKLKYPIAFIKGQPRNVELVYGEAYFDVSSSENHGGTSFNVISKGQQIEVLGTQFNVKAYLDESNTFTTLVEGKIALNTASEEKILAPNQQAVVGKDNSIAIERVNVYNEISWKDGVFSFKGKSLKELMKVLSRWYDVEIVFENEAIENMTFKGVLNKNQNLEAILSSIKSASAMEAYKIKNKTVYIK